MYKINFSCARDIALPPTTASAGKYENLMINICKSEVLNEMCVQQIKVQTGNDESTAYLNYREASERAVYNSC